MSDSMTIRVNTGSILIHIEDTDGERIGEFKFNPSDVGILDRYEKVVDFFNTVKIPDDISDEQRAEEARKLNSDIAQQMNYLLGYDVAEKVFSRCGALALTDSGSFFFENILDGVGGLIEKTTKKRIEKKLAKVRKATAKYNA